MGMTTAGLGLMAGLLIGENLDPLDNTNAYLGVGDGDTAFSEAQTDLQGSNKARFAMNDGYPQRSGGVLTFQADIADDEGNFAISEVAIFNASTSGTMVARWLADLGTKASPNTATLTVTETLSLAE